jgi:hypothetical protein
MTKLRDLRPLHLRHIAIIPRLMFVYTLNSIEGRQSWLFPCPPFCECLIQHFPKSNTQPPRYHTTTDMQWLAALSAAVVLAVGVHGCTTIVVGKAATIDGSVMATHTDDAGTNSDARLGLLAAADHPANSRRPVYYGRPPPPPSSVRLPMNPTHPLAHELYGISDHSTPVLFNCSAKDHSNL